MPHGKLTVVVQSATGIKDPTSHRRGDSYCTLQCGSQVLCTHVAEEGSSHPVFHTEFEFEIDRSTNELGVSVYSKSEEREDELVGYTVFDFKEVFYHGHVVPLTAYPLSRSSGKAGGYINISFKFKARPSPYGASNGLAPVRQHSAAPHRTPHHHPQSLGNRQSYPTGTDAHENFDDDSASSGSESSRSSRGSSRRSGGSRGTYSRRHSQPEHYYREDYENSTQDDYYYEEAYEHNYAPSRQPHHNYPRPSPLAPCRPNPGIHRPAFPGGRGRPRPQVATSSCPPRQPIPGGPQLTPTLRPQLPMIMRPQQHVMMPQQQAMLPQQQVGVPQQHQVRPSQGAQIAQAVAVGVAKAGVRALVGGLLG